MIVLPTQKIPTELKQYVKEGAPIRKMINGYRNKLTNNLQWVLLNDSNHCAQAFCYNIDADAYPQIDSQDSKKLDKIKIYQNEWQKIEIAQNNYILSCKKQVEFFTPGESKLLEDQINRVLGELNYSDDKVVAENILLNSFDSLSQLRTCGLQSLIQQNASVLPSKEEEKQKNFMGAKLFEVPVYHAENGIWGAEHTHKLKIQQKNNKGEAKQKHMEEQKMQE